MGSFAGLRLNAAVLAIATIAVIAAVFRWHVPPLVLAAVMDETAHMLTALLFLGVSRASYPRPTVLAVLAGAVLIDVDHVPMQVFGWDVVTRGTVRPYTHSLATLVVLTAAWVATRGRWQPLVGCIGTVTLVLLVAGVALPPWATPYESP